LNVDCLWVLQALWLLDATVTRFAFPECIETRKWEQIAEEMQTNSFFSTGHLSPQHLPYFEDWACWQEHSCLTRIQHASGDAMCYVYDEKDRKWLAWGLKSEVLHCDAGK
jgi:hypothetical protein